MPRLSTVSRPMATILCVGIGVVVATPVAVSSNGNSPSCRPGLQLCDVIDPSRAEMPWANSTQAFPQCYNPSMYTCAGNFLCPVNAPKISGEYSCSAAAINLTAANTPLSVKIHTPASGQTEGVLGRNFIVDLSVLSNGPEYNNIVPYKYLYQDANFSTFGPGPNPVWPGLVVLQNTTVTKGAFLGPLTNLAGLFQLMGVGTGVNGLRHYNTVWQAASAAFGIGPSELTIYYVNGTAPKYASRTPTPESDGLISNIEHLVFEISNRASSTPDNTAPAMCQQSNTLTNDSAQSNIVIIHPTKDRTVGITGAGWLIDFELKAARSSDSSLSSAAANYSSGFIAQSSPAFKPGMPNPLLPGLVVLLNTTSGNSSSTGFKGPGTNLAALFQINAEGMLSCDSVITIQAAWLVGKPVAGHTGCKASVFFVNGTAPGYISDVSDQALHAMDLLSPIQTVSFMLD